MMYYGYKDTTELYIKIVLFWFVIFNNEWLFHKRIDSKSDQYDTVMPTLSLADSTPKNPGCRAASVTKTRHLFSAFCFPAYSLRILLLATALRFTKSEIRNPKSPIESLSEIRFFHLFVFKQGGGFVR